MSPYGAQGNHPRPQGLSPGDSRWQRRLGDRKNRTWGSPSGQGPRPYLIDLFRCAFRSSPQQDSVARFRLRTNPGDLLGLPFSGTVSAPDTHAASKRNEWPLTNGRKLRYRGFSATSQANPFFSGKLPDYDKIQSRHAKSGARPDRLLYKPAFGDVIELFAGR